MSPSVKRVTSARAVGVQPVSHSPLRIQGINSASCTAHRATTQEVRTGATCRGGSGLLTGRHDELRHLRRDHVVPACHGDRPDDHGRQPRQRAQPDGHTHGRASREGRRIDATPELVQQRGHDALAPPGRDPAASRLAAAAALRLGLLGHRQPVIAAGPHPPGTPAGTPHRGFPL